MVNTKIAKRKLALFLVGVFTLTSVVNLIPAPNASADGMDGSFISSEMSGKVLDHQLVFFLKRCFLLKDMDKVSSSEVASWSWFNEGNTNSQINSAGTPGDETSVRGGMYQNPSVSCGEGSYIKEAFSRFGFTDAVDTFCSLSFTYSRETGGNGKKVNGGDSKQSCKNGYDKGDFDGSGDFSGQRNALNNLLKTSDKYTEANAELSGAGEYIRSYRTLTTWCGVSLIKAYEEGAATSEPNLFKVAVVNKDGSVQYFLGQSSSKTDSSQAPMVARATEGQPSFKTASCGELAMSLRPTSEGGKGYADAYSQYMKTAGQDDSGEDGGETTNDSGNVGETTTCGVDGIGWIVCPVMNFMAKLNDSAFAFLQTFLKIQPSLITDPATKKAWETFRDIANVAFVIAFLVIVYSQITSAGVSNYGIKKLLPRIVIAAILVNLSYYACAIAVDVSNIAGSSTYSLLQSIGANTGTDVGTGWEDNSSDILAKVAAGGIAVVLLVILVILAPTTLLALGMVLLILVARQALVILLIALAPLAFVAYLLPNTENWFKKWWKAFSAVLLVYPIVAAIFGASAIASNVLSGQESELMKLVALGVLAVPLFAVPAVLKGAMGAAGSIGAKLQRAADRAQSRASGQAKQNAKQKAERYKNRFDAKNLDRAKGVIAGSGGRLGDANSRRRKFVGALAGLGSTRAVNREQMDKYAKVAAEAGARNYVADRASTDESYAKKLAGGDAAMAGHVQAYAQQAKAEEFEKDVKAALVMEGRAARNKEELHQRVADTSLESHERVAAMRQFKQVANADETQKMVETLAQLGEDADTGTEDRETVRKIQTQFAETFAGSPLVPASISGTDKGEMQRGEFTKKRDARIKRDLEGDAKGSKVGSDYIVKMDVDEMHEWATEGDAIKTLTSLSPEAKTRFIGAINEAANDDIKGGQFEARQIEQLKKIAGHLGGTVDVTNPKFMDKWS